MPEETPTDGSSNTIVIGNDEQTAEEDLPDSRTEDDAPAHDPDPDETGANGDTDSQTPSDGTSSTIGIEEDASDDLPKGNGSRFPTPDEPPPSGLRRAEDVDPVVVVENPEPPGGAEGATPDVPFVPKDDGAAGTPPPLIDESVEQLLDQELEETDLPLPGRESGEPNAEDAPDDEPEDNGSRFPTPDEPPPSGLQRAEDVDPAAGPPDGSAPPEPPPVPEVIDPNAPNDEEGEDDHRVAAPPRETHEQEGIELDGARAQSDGDQPKAEAEVTPEHRSGEAPLEPERAAQVPSILAADADEPPADDGIDLPRELYEPPPEYAAGALGSPPASGADHGATRPAEPATEVDVPASHIEPELAPEELLEEPIGVSTEDGDEAGLLEQVADAVGDLWDDAKDMVT